MPHPLAEGATLKPPVEGRIAIYVEGAGNEPTIIAFADVWWVAQAGS